VKKKCFRPSVTKLEDLTVLCSELQRAHGDRRLGRLGGPVHGGGAGRGGGGVAVRAVPGRPQLRPRLPQDRDGRAGGGSRHRRRSYRYILLHSFYDFSLGITRSETRGHIVIVLLYVIRNDVCQLILELCTWRKSSKYPTPVYKRFGGFIVPQSVTSHLKECIYLTCDMCIIQ
jgi:hypothetical protein